ncbi:MAG: hypothetical protein ACFB0D_11525 [Phormidesmis sp.]
MTVLKLHSQLTPNYLADLSHNGGGFLVPNQQKIVFYSSFRLMHWQGAFIGKGQRFNTRISLYDSNTQQRVATFEGCRHLVNDITFHPTQPVVVISTGDYDGGYCFQGELWLWNWQTGDAVSLLAESRTALQSYFPTGNELRVLLRLPDEGDFSGEAWERYDWISVNNIEQLMSQPMDVHALRANVTFQESTTAPQSLGFVKKDLVDRDSFKNSHELLGVHNQRQTISHIKWIEPSQLAVVVQSNRLEIWNIDGQHLTTLTFEGSCVQLLKSPTGLLCHVLKSGNSVLYRLIDQQLEPVNAFKQTLVFSIDEQGHLLGRNAAGKTSTDIWLEANCQEQGHADLGHFDCFNHSLMLEGGEALYFLQGTPPTSHEQKQLCRLHLDGSVKPVMLWDTGSRHHMQNIACWGPKGMLLRAFEVHSWTVGQGSCKIECCDLTTGTLPWSQSCHALCIDMVVIAETILAYALTNGSLGLISIADGKQLYEEKLSIDGVDTMATALAARGNQLAVGTLEGRLLLFELADCEAANRLQQITAHHVYSRLAATIKQIR